MWDLGWDCSSGVLILYLLRKCGKRCTYLKEYICGFAYKIYCILFKECIFYLGYWFAQGGYPASILGSF